jgi:plasmid stabilization system protein ParE
MIIRYKESFKNRFNRQLRYIAKDSPSHARKFRDTLRQKIESLKENPYRCRSSIYFDDDTIRDLVFKGYVIVYKIGDESIDVFGFTKYQAMSMDEQDE